jgi:hypothetical protein
MKLAFVRGLLLKAKPRVIKIKSMIMIKK